MIEYTTIGANYKTTLKYIDNVISEWYVPHASATMTMEQLRSNEARLTENINHWLEVMNGERKNKAVRNLQGIIDVQSGKLEAYTQMIAIKEAEQIQNLPPVKENGNYTSNPAEVVNNTETLKQNWLMWGVIGVAAVLILKRN